MDNSFEQCLMFDEKLEQREDGSAKPCDKCKGKYFEEDKIPNTIFI